MPRTARNAPGGMVYHVINRGVGKKKLFFKDEDYLAFERVIVETLEKRLMRILSYCLMPNHWHFVLWPENDSDLGSFMQRLKRRKLDLSPFLSCPRFFPQELVAA
jgi:putative transposase